MLQEYEKVSQPAGTEGFRRWFSDERMDLILWYSPAGALRGFQLCYDRDGRERAFTWQADGVLIHTAVDSGESTPLRNDSPILVPDGAPPVARVLEEFRRRAEGLEPAVTELVAAKIASYRKGG